MNTNTMKRIFTLFAGLFLLANAGAAPAASGPNSAPSKFQLAQNHPNPFNPSTSIEFELPETAFITLKVYNILGQEIRTLARKQFSPGIHALQWDGKDNNGSAVASGVYFYRMVASDRSVDSQQDVFVQTRRMILVR